MNWMSKWGALAVMSFMATPAWGTGLWNLPTTGRQYLGVGCGAGYHSPLVVGSPWRGGAASPGVRRVATPLWPQGPFAGGLMNPSEIQPTSDSCATAAQAFPQPDITPALRSQPSVTGFWGFSPPPLRPPAADDVYIEPLPAGGR